VARDSEGPDRLMKTVCPLHGPSDQVDWAGLPVNLDLAFSREQRDKVYVQHVMRKQGSQLWRRPCNCEAAADQKTPDPARADSISGR
jgi:hypothetical protein